MSDNNKTSCGKFSLWGYFSRMPLDSPVKTMLITVIICLIASVLVTFLSLSLNPIQTQNALDEKRRNILQVAGLYKKNTSIDVMFKDIETRVVDLRTGKFSTDVGANFDEKRALKDRTLSRKLSKEQDIASIRYQSYYQVVYLIKDARGVVTKIILPVHGYGLWSTLYGFMAVGVDGNTIKALKFYSHGETPGLGGEVDNPVWQAKWHDKKIHDKAGRIAISVVKGGAVGESQVDALSGATLTSRGVNNLVRFWVGKEGFGPFLQRIASKGLEY